MRESRVRSAFTMIELMVVLGIIGLLVSLLLVGVNAARESARRLTCTNNLKQIGLGLQNYMSTYQVFPRGAGTGTNGPLVGILPYVGYDSLFQQIDFSRDLHGNLKVLETRIPIYRCPSTMKQEDGVRTDYVLNRGTTLGTSRNSPWLLEEGIFPNERWFSRGLSQTPLMSETCPKVIGTRKGSPIMLPYRYIVTNDESQAFANECDSTDWSATTHSYSNGQYWYGGGTANYYHIFGPNEKSCSNDGHIQESLDTATSMHSGGVNVLFADGHIEFMADGIDRNVWVLLGKR